MGLIPEQEIDSKQDMELTTYPTKTYHMELESGRIRGFSDDLESIRQVIFLALNTERSTYLAFSDNYGIELSDLFDMPGSFVMAELERRITETLTWDSRIESVGNFAFEINGRNVHVTFTVYTDFGNIEFESEMMF